MRAACRPCALKAVGIAFTDISGTFQIGEVFAASDRERLERQGYVAAKWSTSENGRRRKYYRITKEGRAQLTAQREQWRAVDGTLRGIWMQVCTA
jgi:predicted ArsR family transcriptional regulator